MQDNIKRITIIGGSGTGKTTLSENLGRVMNLPVYHIDAYNHLKNWQVRDKAERDKMIMERVSEEKWVIDGTYKDTLKKRLENTDLAIYLDYSSMEAMKGALTRHFEHKGEEKPEIPGCNEDMSFHFFWWVLNWRKNKRPTVVKILDDFDKNKLLVFKNRKSLNKWFENEFGCKIEKLDWNKKI